MDHLIIGGTGAVGVTWAQILHKAGDNVSVYVRPKYATEIEANGGALTTFDIKKAAGLNFALLAAATVVSYIGLRIAFEPFCCAWFVAFLLGAAMYVVDTGELDRTWHALRIFFRQIGRMVNFGKFHSFAAPVHFCVAQPLCSAGASPRSHRAEDPDQGGHHRRCPRLQEGHSVRLHLGLPRVHVAQGARVHQVHRTCRGS